MTGLAARLATLNERRVRILTALVALTFAGAASTFGIKAAAGALEDVYHLEATFSAAGQGLIRDSDVKIHGVNVGRVASVRLVEGRARVRMEIDAGERIPARARAAIRPKTLFGEKYVDIDPGPDERQGPFLADEGEIAATLGGFELERVLADLHPVLAAVDPGELATVVGTLAGAAEGSGDEIARQIASFSRVARVSAANDAATRATLADLAALSEELARRAGDVVGLATDLNAALPALSARGGELAALLDGTARLSADVADLLTANRPLLVKGITEGGKALAVLADRRARIPGLVLGFRYFFQLLNQIGSNPALQLPDGTSMVAIKIVAGGGSPCGQDAEGCPLPQDRVPHPPAAGSGAPTTEGTSGAPTAPDDRLVRLVAGGLAQ